MRILFLTINAFSRYATAKRALGMGEALAQSGHEVFIAAMDCHENRNRILQEAPHCQPMWFGEATLFKEVLSKLRIVRNVRPDLVFSSSYTPRNLAMCSCLFPKGTKFVHEFCELYSHYSGGFCSLRLMERMAIKESRHLVCASRCIEAYFMEQCHSYGMERNVFYLPYAYPPYLVPDDKAKHGRDGQIVVFMAALWRGYGVYDVITAMEKVLPNYPYAKLLIIGGGPEEESIRKYVLEHGLSNNIILKGFVPEDHLNEHFAKADVFIAPLHDSFQDRARCPSKVYYYIPYNKPIVTCRIGDPYEALGEHGFYYKPDDIDDMSRCICEALERCGTFSFPDGFIDRHSWRARAKQFETAVASWNE